MKSTFVTNRQGFSYIFSYAEQAKIISDRFRDQPLTPLETAKFWVKHVAKNKGAPHLRSVAVDLPFYKLYNLDVWAFISAICTLIYILIVKITQVLISIIQTPKPEKRHLKKESSKKKPKKA